jgi:hypothetical protein
MTDIDDRETENELPISIPVAPMSGRSFVPQDDREADGAGR